MKRLVLLLLILGFSPPVLAEGIFAFGIPAFGKPSVTVATLPTCNASRNGLIYTVTDALAPTIAGIVVGGGAVTLIVHCNGTNWVVS